MHGHENWDCILIDEGQDLPPEFYRIAWRTLREPKRLYWAYDEAQGIGAMNVPDGARVFGRDHDGNLRVDLSGKYGGGISKGMQFKRSYRTPGRILMAAHAINMGLYREEGVLQGPSTQKDWEAIGYEVEGDFLHLGQIETVSRTLEHNCHPVDQPGFPHLAALGETLRWQTFDTDEAEIAWGADRIREVSVRSSRSDSPAK